MSEFSNAIVVVDDHPLFRGALVQALGADLPGVEGKISILEAGDFKSLQRILQGEIRIDLILLDLALPDAIDFSCLLTVCSEHAEIPVVVVSASDDSFSVNRAFDLGASGFIPKSTSLSTIRNAVACVLKGSVWKPDCLVAAQNVDDELAGLATKLRKLTKQQTRVMAMISQGLSNKQIAHDLGVSEATIKAHVSAPLLKLGANSRTQVVVQLAKLNADSLKEYTQTSIQG